MKKTILLILFITIINVSCKLETSSQYVYHPPVDLNDGLEVGTLNKSKIDVKYLEAAVTDISRGKYKEIHSMLILKDNKLVFEEYFQGHIYQWDAPHYHRELIQWGNNTPHSMMSCTKSFTSACIGIGIDKGFINDVHQSIFDYLPEHQHLKTNNREYITLEHLLTMSSGLAWDEWSAYHGTSANDIDMLYFDCEDPITCVLEKPWWAEPGKIFTYNGGGTVVLGGIIKNAANMTIDEFSTKYLFEPLGINSTQWTQYENGIFDMSGSLKVTPRDMLKFGSTYLNNGLWSGTIIVSNEWVAKSSEPYNNNKGIDIPGEDSGKCGYTYSWWTSEFAYKGTQTHMFRAGGWGGQEIMVFPELDMVVVFTGGNYASNTSLFKVIRKYVLPAISS